MVNSAQNWRVLKEDLVHTEDGKETLIKAGSVVAYQTKHHRLDGVPGVEMHHPVSMGVGGTGKRQVFTGYHFKASRAKLTPTGIVVTTVGDGGIKGTVWLLPSTVYRESDGQGGKIRTPIHKTLVEAYGLLDLE